ncbi:MAG: septal ring lytic transglycosylase RlpA family protein [Chlorobiaceae bacterium]|nr:septal ring lytic transglycosylase RlpA family protein [Chlorobiaceae bacterium]
MHKKHRALISCLTLSASLFISTSPNSALANETERKALASYTESKAAKTAINVYVADANSGKSTEEIVGKKNMFLIAEGKASFYANRFQGRTTASGAQFDKKDYTAAHRSLPFGTMVRVTNLANGRMVLVKVNDRGPNIKSRIIDLSKAAAREIGMVDNGIGDVRIEAYN